MVFFVCEACNETLKKNQVEKHTYKCRACEAVTCVDCSVTFYGNDYAAHTTCISEAEKYEKSLYKPKTNAKPKAQDIWTALIEDIESHSNEAPSTVKPHLSKLASLGNVPRNKKKFINFAKNSLKLHNEKALEDIWNFLDGVRIKEEAKHNPPAPAAKPAAEEVPAEVPAAETAEPSTEKKDKKKKNRESDKSSEEEKPSKKQKVEEPKEEEPVVEEEKESKEAKKSKKEKKSKKDKKEKKDKE